MISLRTMFGMEQGAIIETYSAEAQAVFSLMPDALTDTLKNAMADNIIDPLVASGDWAEIDVFELFALNTEANALTDWKGNVTPSNSGATFNVNESFSATGTQKVLTGFAPGTNGVKYKQNDATKWVFVLSSTDDTDQRWLSDGWNQRTVASRLDLKMNGGTVQISGQPTGWDGPNLYATRLRDVSGIYYLDGYINDTIKNNISVITSAPATTQEAVLHRNYSGTGITGKVAAVGYGSSTVSIPNVYNAIVNFLKAIGVLSVFPFGVYSYQYAEAYAPIEEQTNYYGAYSPI